MPKDNTGQTKKYSENEALDSLSVVVGEIAHDFNNILSLIFGYVEMAMSEIPEEHRARSDLEHVLAAGDRAKDLVERILTFSNQNKLVQSDIPIAKSVRDALKAFNEKLPDRIKLNSSFDPGTGIVFANSSEIYQITLNLCNNSLQAIGKKKGHIDVSLSYLDRNSDCVSSNPELEKMDYAKLTVSDNGCGMDLSTMEKMYIPFFSAGPDGKSGSGRAGLGLTTVYKIIHDLGGTIIADSTPGEGTSFEILLPLVRLEKEKGKKQAETPKAVKQVLFIDDEVAITKMAEQMLKKNGFGVDVFNDANQAINHFRKNPHVYDLVITDLVMPELSGTELASMLSNMRPNLPIILTTGFSEKITASSCKQWGISLVINKPFAIQDLLSAIKSIS